METIELNALPHAKATDVLATGAPVYLFVNPVEYHGPHLPLYNDYHLSFASSQDLRSRPFTGAPSTPPRSRRASTISRAGAFRP
ncbi:MAG: hypothetical protein HY075_12205 [Deltaproteobacteria bacterium]|nr:hypothetical protein [Deltaproteobacteria bacterium]